MEALIVDREMIHPNPNQPRRHFDEESLRELAQSLKTSGLLVPLTVERHGDSYLIIDGERRWRAAAMIGMREMPVVVRDAVKEDERTIAALTTSIQRKELTPTEEGRAFKKLLDIGVSVNALARQLGINTSRITHRVAILSLPEEIGDLMDANMLPIDLRVVSAIQSIKDVETQIALCRKLARPGLGIKAVQAAVERYHTAAAAKRMAPTSIPSLDLPANKVMLQRPNWDALAQLGKLPRWDQVQKAARATCDTCALRMDASKVVCQACPAVTFMVHLIGAASEHGAD